MIANSRNSAIASSPLIDKPPLPSMNLWIVAASMPVCLAIAYRDTPLESIAVRSWSLNELFMGFAFYRLHDYWSMIISQLVQHGTESLIRGHRGTELRMQSLERVVGIVRSFIGGDTRARLFIEQGTITVIRTQAPQPNCYYSFSYRSLHRNLTRQT